MPGPVDQSIREWLGNVRGTSLAPKNIVFQVLSADPPMARRTTGDLWFNTTSSEWKGWDGSSIIVFGSGGGGGGASDQISIQSLALDNHTMTLSPPLFGGGVFSSLFARMVDFDRFGTGTPELIWSQDVVPGGAGAEVVLYNVTDGSPIATSVPITTTGVKTMPFVPPAGKKLVMIQHRALVLAMGASRINAASIFAG